MSDPKIHAGQSGYYLLQALEAQVAEIERAPKQKRLSPDAVKEDARVGSLVDQMVAARKKNGVYPITLEDLDACKVSNERKARVLLELLVRETGQSEARYAADLGACLARMTETKPPKRAELQEVLDAMLAKSGGVPARLSFESIVGYNRFECFEPHKSNDIYSGIRLEDRRTKLEFAKRVSDGEWICFPPAAPSVLIRDWADLAELKDAYIKVSAGLPESAPDPMLKRLRESPEVTASLVARRELAAALKADIDRRIDAHNLKADGAEHGLALRRVLVTETFPKEVRVQEVDKPEVAKLVRRNASSRSTDKNPRDFLKQLHATLARLDESGDIDDMKIDLAQLDSALGKLRKKELTFTDLKKMSDELAAILMLAQLGMFVSGASESPFSSRSPSKAVEAIEAMIGKGELSSLLSKLEQLPSFTKALDSFMSVMHCGRAA
jgi:hypothetical protein